MSLIDWMYNMAMKRRKRRLLSDKKQETRKEEYYSEHDMMMMNNKTTKAKKKCLLHGNPSSNTYQELSPMCWLAPAKTHQKRHFFHKNQKPKQAKVLKKK